MADVALELRKNLTTQVGGVFVGSTVLHQAVTSWQLFIGMSPCGRRFALDDPAFEELGNFSLHYGRLYADRHGGLPRKPCLNCAHGGKHNWRQLWRKYQRETFNQLVGAAKHQGELFDE